MAVIDRRSFPGGAMALFGACGKPLESKVFESKPGGYKILNPVKT